MFCFLKKFKIITTMKATHLIQLFRNFIKLYVIHSIGNLI